MRLLRPSSATSCACEELWHESRVGEEPEPKIVSPDLGLPTFTLAALLGGRRGALHVHDRAKPGSTVTVDGCEISLRPKARPLA